MDSGGSSAVRAIGPELPVEKKEKAEKTAGSKRSASTAFFLPPKKQTRGNDTRLEPQGLTGSWSVTVQRPFTTFQYTFVQSEDNLVSGTGSVLGDAPRASKVTGHVQGYVFTWNEEGNGKFRANLSMDGRSFTGTAQLDPVTCVSFNATRNREEGTQLQTVTVIESRSRDSIRCPVPLLQAHIPGLSKKLAPVVATDCPAFEGQG